MSVSQDQFELWEKASEKGRSSNRICYSLVTLPSAWIEEVMVRRLRLGPVSPVVLVALDSNAMSVVKGSTGCGDSMCHHDLDEMVFIDPS